MKNSSEQRIVRYAQLSEFITVRYGQDLATICQDGYAVSFHEVEQNCVTGFTVYAKDGVGTSVEFLDSIFCTTFEGFCTPKHHAQVGPLIDPLYNGAVELNVVWNFSTFSVVEAF